MENYSVTGRIGEGAHGQVLRGVQLKTGMEVALKKVLLKKLDEGIPNSVIREIKTLQEVDCKYVMKLVDYFPHGVGFVLVFDLMPSGLWEVIHDVENPVTEPHIKTYMHMLLSGVDYLHSHNIMHRDLKPANLLISSTGELRIADLGLGRIICSDRPYTHQVATRWYRPPELLYGARNYTSSVDIWAVGCILAEMYNKSPLFPGESDIEQLALVIRGLGTPSWRGITSLPDYNKISFPPARPQPWDTLVPDVEPSVLQIVSALVTYDPSSRLTARQALNHNYFYTQPLPCPLYEMPRPPSDHRQRLRPAELRVDKPPSELFRDLDKLVNG
ncbi:cyclin-dependent kinase 20-like [Homalodisca vitripennis]|nr:cyclin-dependent kinase 20-like [Homalodisca vitripennis]KAG8327525.1 Cyclin-dependent kinase 20 [Homalodisca vitripennis]